MKNKIILLFCTSLLCSVSAESVAQWNMVRFDGYNVFQHVCTPTANTCFVIGAEPLNYQPFLLRTNDGGIVWDSISFNLESEVYTMMTDIFFSDAQNGLIGGIKNNKQLLLKTTDNGSSWTDITPDPGSDLQITSVCLINQYIGFASDGNKLFSTIDGGVSWTSRTPPISISDISFYDGNHGLISGFTPSEPISGAILETEDGGQNWSTKLGSQDPTVFPSGFGKLDKVSSGTTFSTQLYTNKLQRTIDGGNSWTTIVVDSVWGIQDFDFITDDIGQILSTSGQIFSTTDGGQSWFMEYATEWGFYGPSVYLYSIALVDNIGFVAGTNGLIKKYKSSLLSTMDYQNPDTDLVLYPNPLNNHQSLCINNGGITGKCDLNILNAQGELVFIYSVNVPENNRIITLPELNLSSGVYYVTLRTKEKSSTKKLIISG